MLRRARELRKSATDAERLLWKHIRKRQLAGSSFADNTPWATTSAISLAWKQGMVVGLDGSQHAEQVDYDAGRDTFLKARGFRVLRFWNSDVLNRTTPFSKTIFEALHRPHMDGRFD